jgi:hypothetical protein
MENENIDAQAWAEMTYGTVMLSDQRRRDRAVQMAHALASHPAESLPTQMGSHAAVKAAYRFLECPKVTYERLMSPYLQQTMQRTQEQPRVLLIQDMTELSYTHHPKTTGLGPVGASNRGRGSLLQTVLAVCPTSKEVRGIAAPESFLRERAPKGEKSQARKKRKDREPLVWQRQVQRIGAAPATCEYIHVGDRGSDIFAFMRLCKNLECGFTLRVQHDRRVDLLVEQGETPVPFRYRFFRKEGERKRQDLVIC